jgi:hypothetical protein
MKLSFRPHLRANIPMPAMRSVRGSVRRRARIAILLGIALLSLAQLGLGLAVETVKPEWRDPEYGHRIKQVRELQPKMIAVGSSRTLMGLSPEATGLDVYNFGQTGAGPLQLFLTASRILDGGAKPDAILIELFPAALVGNGPAEEMIEAWGPRWNHGDVRRLAPFADDPAKLEREWLRQRVAPWHSLRFPLMNHIRPDWLPHTKRQDFQWANMDRRGWLKYPTEQVTDAERARLTEKAGESYRRQLANYTIGDVSDRALREIVERCRRDGIRVAFYLMPESETFASWYPPGAMAAFRRYAASLDAPVFDSADGFAESEFADSHHLLPSGAARFSHRLASEHLLQWK